MDFDYYQMKVDYYTNIIINSIYSQFDPNMYIIHRNSIKELVDSELIDYYGYNKIKALQKIQDIYIYYKYQIMGDDNLQNINVKVDQINEIIKYIDCQIDKLRRKKQSLERKNTPLTFTSSFNYTKLCEYITKEDKYFVRSDRDDLISLFEGKTLKRKFPFLGTQKNILGTMFWDLFINKAFREESVNKGRIKIYICEYFTYKNKPFSKALVNKYITTSKINKRLPISRNYLKIDITQFFYPKKERQ